MVTLSLCDHLLDDHPLILFMLFMVTQSLASGYCYFLDKGMITFCVGQHGLLPTCSYASLTSSSQWDLLVVLPWVPRGQDVADLKSKPG